MTDIYTYTKPDYRPDCHDSPFSVFIFSRKTITEIATLPDTFQGGQKVVQIPRMHKLSHSICGALWAIWSGALWPALTISKGDAVGTLLWLTYHPFPGIVDFITLCDQIKKKPTQTKCSRSSNKFSISYGSRIVFHRISLLCMLSSCLHFSHVWQQEALQSSYGIQETNITF